MKKTLGIILIITGIVCGIFAVICTTNGAVNNQWWLWIVADLLSVALCLTQEMWWMAALYLAYVMSAVIGLHYWNTRGVYL